MCTTIPNNYAEDKVALINKMPVVENKKLGLNEIRKDIWIADSGASSYMTNDISGLINQRNINSKVKIGIRDYVEAQVIGDLRGTVKQLIGTDTPILLTNVKYVPQGYKLTGNKKGISIQKLNRKYLFDQHIKSRDGELVGVEIETLQTDTTTICRGCTHIVLEHPSSETTNMTAK